MCARSFGLFSKTDVALRCPAIQEYVCVCNVHSLVGKRNIESLEREDTAMCCRVRRQCSSSSAGTQEDIAAQVLEKPDN